MLSAMALILAGGLGAVSRAVIDAVGARHRRTRSGETTSTTDPSSIPWSTTAINIGGSLLAGVVAGAVAGGSTLDTIASVLAIGYLGAFTTFSTAMLQTVDLLTAGARGRALVHAVVPLVASVSAAALGWALVG